MDFGYSPNPEKTDNFCASLPVIYGQQIDSLTESDDNADALNYRYVTRMMKINRLHSHNQGNVGMCVGTGTATAADVTVACDIAIRNEPERWVAQASPDLNYALGRQVSDQLGRGDGSYGGAAAKGLREGGCFFMIEYPGMDARTLEPMRARKLATTGIDEKLIEIASKTQMKATWRLKSVEQLWSILRNGYGANLCSNIGFDGKRDSDGAIRRNGSWNHSMACTSRRTTKSGRRLFLIHQSWGDDWTDGPYFEDQPFGSFWADWDAVAAIIRQDDSFAYGEFNGFPRRKLPDYGATGVI